MFTGFFVGQLIVGLMMSISNLPTRSSMTEAAILMRQASYVIGMVLSFTAAGALVGTALTLI